MISFVYLDVGGVADIDLDNGAEHVAAAKQFGWQTFLYDTANPEHSSERLLAQSQNSLRA